MTMLCEGLAVSVVCVHICAYACKIVKVVASMTILLLISTSHQYELVFWSSQTCKGKRECMSEGTNGSRCLIYGMFMYH